MKLLSPWDILIIAGILLLIFGPKRLPQMGRSLGESMRGFKDAVTDRVDKQDAVAEQEQQKQLPPAQPAPPPVAAQPQSDPRERDTVV